MVKAYSGEISHWTVNRRRRSAARRRRAHSKSASSQPSMEATGHRLIQNLPFYTALKYMAPLILALAGLKYQGKADGLFEANPVPPWCFLGATFGYGLTLGTMKQMQFQNENGIWFQILNRAAFAFGLASIVSLVSIFLPHRFSFLPLIMLTPLPVVLAWPIFGPTFNMVKVIMHITWYWLYTGIIKSAFDSIRAKVAYWARGSNFTQEASLPK